MSIQKIKIENGQMIFLSPCAVCNSKKIDLLKSKKRKYC